MICVYLLAPVTCLSAFAASPPLQTPPGKQGDLRPGGLQMKKFVSEQASFILYLPEGWTASEGASGGFRTLFITDPAGKYGAAMFHGVSPTGNDLVALARRFIGNVGQQFPDLQIRNPMVSNDKTQIVYDGVFTLPQRGRREFRAWISGSGGNFIYSSVEAPEAELAGIKQLLLTILSNVRVMKGAFGEASPSRVALVQRRLSDGSAYFQIPQNWQYQEFGKGSFAAKDPTGAYSFIVATAQALDPRMRVTAPGVFVSSYLPPHRAMQFFATAGGWAANIQFLEVIPKHDLARQIGQVYTAGPVTAEEFLYTFVAQGRKSKGYTFGVSFGSRLGTNWSFWHITVGGPLEGFDSFAPTFVTMMQSYKIDDQFARNYIAQGMARLREMQKQTAALVSRNAQEIRQMMQSAYDERQRSMDYIDYQRTNYIRGQQDWVSHVEGGTVYHTDSWGTKNTATG